MFKKKYLFIIVFTTLFIILFTHFTFARDTALNDVAAQDNTVYNAGQGTQEDVDTTEESNSQNPVLSYTELQDSSELSISNMINIVLAAIGVVLILLGIAILLKIK